MNVVFFSDQYEFRNWLKTHFDKETELFVGFYKVKTGKPSMSWSQSVDQALCFGWIDSVRKSIDDESYCIRFTPRKKTSIWSAVNIKKVEELKKAGLMKEAGMQAFGLRKESNSYIYAHEKQYYFTVTLENIFKENRTAWKFFINQTPSYKKMITHWVMSAKQEKTQLSRLGKAINESQHQRLIRFM
jgi:uncharacterized protein YdeI (YjbR/CyaY-like superfamily)